MCEFASSIILLTGLRFTLSLLEVVSRGMLLGCKRDLTSEDDSQRGGLGCRTRCLPGVVCLSSGQGGSWLVTAR